MKPLGVWSGILAFSIGASSLAFGQSDAAKAAELALFQATSVDELHRVAASAKASAESTRDAASKTEYAKIEALALGRSYSLGDVGVKERLSRLVTNLRRDTNLTQEDKWQVCSLYEFSNALLEKGASGAASERRKIAEIAKALIAEFPGAPSAYQYVLGSAQTETDPDTAKSLVAFLLQGAKTPAYVRTSASFLSARFDLLGKRLWTVVPDGEGFIPHSLDLPDGQKIVLAASSSGSMPRVLVYSWAETNPYSQDCARKLKRFVEAGYFLVGICTSKETETARLLGKGLPGVQVFDPAGVDGRASIALHFDEGFSAYTAGRDGLIDSVTLGLQLETATPNSL